MAGKKEAAVVGLLSVLAGVQFEEYDSTYNVQAFMSIPGDRVCELYTFTAATNSGELRGQWQRAGKESEG